jgi:hypothetical protein
MNTGARQLLTDDQYEDAIDERGVIRDGKTYRAAMYMMDSAQLAAASIDHSFDVARNTSEREQAYFDAEARLTNAWRDPANAFKEEDEPLRPDEIITPWRGRFSAIAPEPTNDAQREPETLADAYAKTEARLNTAYLDPFAAWRDPSPAIATEPQQPTNDAKQEPASLADAYELYHQHLTNGWRNPPSMAPITPDATPATVSLLPPPSSTLTDERERLYAKRNELYEQAWRNPL